MLNNISFFTMFFMQHDIKACVMFTCCWKISSKFWKYKKHGSNQCSGYFFALLGQSSQTGVTTQNVFQQPYVNPYAFNISNHHDAMTATAFATIRPTDSHGRFVGQHVRRTRLFACPRNGIVYCRDITCIDIFASAASWTVYKKKVFWLTFLMICTSLNVLYIQKIQTYQISIRFI